MRYRGDGWYGNDGGFLYEQVYNEIKTARARLIYVIRTRIRKEPRGISQRRSGGERAPSVIHRLRQTMMPWERLCLGGKERENSRTKQTIEETNPTEDPPRDCSNRRRRRIPWQLYTVQIEDGHSAMHVAMQQLHAHTPTTRRMRAEKLSRALIEMDAN